MEHSKREKLKRQATAATVAAVASAGIMVGGILPDDGVFDDGAEDFPTPIVETVPLGASGGDAPVENSSRILSPRWRIWRRYRIKAPCLEWSCYSIYWYSWYRI